MVIVFGLKSGQIGLNPLDTVRVNVWTDGLGQKVSLEVGEVNFVYDK